MSHASSEVPSEISAPNPREIAIFWDYENLALPSWAKATDACQAISRAVSKLGRIADRRIYFDYSTADAGGKMPPWTAFDSCGFDLVNTPRRNNKETLDKKLIADVWAFAWDSSSRRSGGHCGTPCVVLLTSDGDFAYTLNKLRDRGVLCVVIHGSEANVAGILRESADKFMSFESEILVRKNNTTVHETRQNHGVEVQRGVTSSHTPIIQADMKSLCKAICGNQSPDGWISAGLVGVHFGKIVSAKSAEEQKLRYRRARSEAIAIGWIKHGKRVSNAPDGEKTIEVFRSNESNSDTKFEISGEDYLRVTPKGRLAASNIHHREHITATSIFFKNVARSASVKDLVSYLENNHGCTIVSAQGKEGPHFSNYGFAKVKVKTAEQAKILIDLSKNSRLILHQRHLEADYDCFPSTNTVGESSKIQPRILNGKGEKYAPRRDFSLKPGNASTRIFFKNISRKTSIQDLMSYLETEHGCSVLHAKAENFNSTGAAEYRFARVQVGTPRDSDKLIQLSRDSKLVLNDRVLEAMYDKFPSTSLNGDATNLPEIYYDQDVTLHTSVSPDAACLCVLAYKHAGTEGSWILGSEIGGLFKSASDGPPTDKKAFTKTRFRKAYKEAWETGLIEVGRRKIDSEGRRGCIVVVSEHAQVGHDYSKEMFIRLSPVGRHHAATAAKHDAKQGSATVSKLEEATVRLDPKTDSRDRKTNNVNQSTVTTATPKGPTTSSNAINLSNEMIGMDSVVSKSEVTSKPSTATIKLTEFSGGTPAANSSTSATTETPSVGSRLLNLLNPFSGYGKP